MKGKDVRIHCKKCGRVMTQGIEYDLFAEGWRIVLCKKCGTYERTGIPSKVKTEAYKDARG